MRLPESRIFALTALCCAALMTGCASDDDPAPPAAKLFNTLNVLYTVNDPGNNAFPDNEIYYYVDNPNASANQSAVLLAPYDKGDNRLLTLDTDLDLQGYEYSLFVRDNEVFLLDYDKDRNNTPRGLVQTVGDICAIHPMRMISERSTEEDTRLEPIYQDLPGFFIEVNATSSCTDQGNTVYQVEFSLDGGAEDNTTISLADYSYIQGAYIVDFGSGGTTIQGEEQELRTGFLGYNHRNNLMVLYDTDFQPLWSASFPATAANFEVTQASRNMVAIQADDSLYVLSITEIFSAGPNENPGDQSVEIPPSSEIQALLTTPSEMLDSATLLGDKIVQSIDYFLIIDGFNIRQLDTVSRKFDPVNISQPIGLTDVSAQLRNQDKVLFVIKTTATEQQLSYIDLDGGSESASVVTASRIDTYLTLEDTYLNTYNSGSDTFAAHWIDDKLNRTDYTNSQIVVADDLRTQDHAMFILGSDSAPAANGLTEPTLYEFDEEEGDGRKRENIDDVFGPVALGTLNSDVDTISAFTIVNDDYALLSTLDASGNASNYFMNPDEPDSLQNITRIDSASKVDSHE